jgi:hypothetical protein
MQVTLRPLKWEDRRPSYSSVYTVLGIGSVSFDSEPMEHRWYGGDVTTIPQGWYYRCGWDHGDCEIGDTVPCESLEHGKAMVEASYLAHLKPAFDFIRGEK